MTHQIVVTVISPGSKIATLDQASITEISETMFARSPLKMCSMKEQLTIG